MPAVEVDDLTIRHGPLTAVDGICFHVEPGEVVALLGPNGAGKTSTIDVLEGYRSPDGGQVRVLGLDPVSDHRRLTERVGVMLQDGGVNPGIRPHEVLALLAAMYRDPADPDVLLALVGLSERRAVSWRHLSGGERQRLSLAMALVGRPDVVFLDEPTSGVDAQGRRDIRSIVADLARGGCAVLLCTHEMDEAERVADRAVILDRGTIVAQGSVAELRTGEVGSVRFSARPGLDVDDLSRHIGATVVEREPGEYEVPVATDSASTLTTPALTAAVATWLADHDIELGDLRSGRQRLEDVFLRLTRRDETDR